MYKRTRVPNACLHGVILVQLALAVLLPILPVSHLLAPVRLGELAEPVFLFIFLLTLVATSIGPGEDSVPLYPVVDPVTLEDPPVLPSLLPKSMNVVVLELSFLFTPVSPGEDTPATFESIFLVAFLLSAVIPILNAFPMLFVVAPEANAGVIVIFVLLLAETMCFVVKPLPHLFIPFYMYKFPDPTRSVIDEFSFLLRLVVPGLLPVSLAHLSGIYQSGLHRIFVIVIFNLGLVLAGDRVEVDTVVGPDHVLHLPLPEVKDCDNPLAVVLDFLALLIRIANLQDIRVKFRLVALLQTVVVSDHVFIVQFEMFLRH